jgi:bifunctional DNase/RNase
MQDQKMIGVQLGRVVIRDGADQQYIYLRERGGQRGFPIVIGTSEACEIRRVVHDIKPERPLTHQLTFDAIKALGHKLRRIDIIDLRNNTFYAQLVIEGADGEISAVVDARPSDAVALAMRAACPIHVAESVLEQVRTDVGGPDPLPNGEADEVDGDDEAADADDD